MLHNIGLVSATHQHESARHIHTSPPLKPLPHLSPYATPLGYHRAPSWSSLHHAANSQRLRVFHVVMYVFLCYTLNLSHPLFLYCAPQVCSLCPILIYLLKMVIISLHHGISFFPYTFTLFLYLKQSESILSLYTILMAQMVRNLPAMWDTWVRSVSREHPLQKRMAIYSILPGESHRQVSLAGQAHKGSQSPEGHKEFDTTEWPMLSLNTKHIG